MKSSPGQVPDEVTKCKLCDVPKHEAAWEYHKEYDRGRRCRGGTCLACVRACSASYLSSSRSPVLIQEAACETAVLQISRLIRDSLGSKDVCRCSKCEHNRREAR